MKFVKIFIPHTVFPLIKFKETCYMHDYLTKYILLYTFQTIKSKRNIL